MADVQKQLLKFHNSIKLSENSQNAKLREKREIIINALKDGLKRISEESGSELLKFEHFNQGSYAMGTGINPKDGDYDIDVGIVFQNQKWDFATPVQLKKTIRDAVSTDGRNVRIRRPCVTVEYLKNEEVDYHVDLAIYAQTPGDDLELAVGREHSSAENQNWEYSDPKGLISAFKDKYDGDDAAQLRRTVRYLKKWRDKNFASGAPTSIALTCAAYHWFAPTKSFGEYTDTKAFKNVVDAMYLEAQGRRLSVPLPVTPYTDLLAGMTESQMDNMRVQLEIAQSSLQQAIDTESVVEACEKLKKLLGDEFEVPDDGGDGGSGSRTAKRSAVPPYVTTGTSA